MVWAWFQCCAILIHGPFIVSNFEKPVAEEERAKAQILKQNRMWYEEQVAAEKVAKGGGKNKKD